MQCWINGIEINKVPHFLTQDPTTSTHFISIADPTELEGVVSYFEFSLPTSAEFEDPEIVLCKVGIVMIGFTLGKFSHSYKEYKTPQMSEDTNFEELIIRAKLV